LKLEELGHNSQPPSPIHTDTTTTVGIVNNTIKCQQSRAMEMQYSGFLMLKPDNSSASIINQDKITWVTTFPNIILLTHINMFACIMFT
jgi:hypothetical protein